MDRDGRISPSNMIAGMLHEQLAWHRKYLEQLLQYHLAYPHLETKKLIP